MRVAGRVALLCVGVIWLALTASVAFNETVSHAWKFILGAIALLVLVGSVMYVFLTGKRVLRRPRSGAVALAATAGLLSSAPVPVKWDDGCNDHLSTSYALAAPYILLARPNVTQLAFGGTQTLMACPTRDATA
jgi:hypothetical protein